MGGYRLGVLFEGKQGGRLAFPRREGIGTVADCC